MSKEKELVRVDDPPTGPGPDDTQTDKPADNEKTFAFEGPQHGAVWNPVTNKPLVIFEGGMTETTDLAVRDKLRDMGYKEIKPKV